MSATAPVAAGELHVWNGSQWLPGGLIAGGGGGGGGAGLENYWLPEAYGAVGDNVADDSDALQTAVDYAKHMGGTVLLHPRKSYKVTKPTYLGGAPRTFRITSNGGLGGGRQATARIRLEGDSGGSRINGGIFQFWHGNRPFPPWFTGDPRMGMSRPTTIRGIEIDHIQFAYSVDDFGGPHAWLINLAVQANNAGDIQPFYIHDCEIRGSGHLDVNDWTNGAIAIRMYEAICGQISRNYISNNREGIALSDRPDTPSPQRAYNNVITIDNNQIAGNSLAHISINAGGQESIKIQNNTFEDCPRDGAIYGSPGSGFDNGVIDGNWFGDASTWAKGTGWIKGLIAPKRGTISGNMFNSNPWDWENNRKGTHIRLGGGNWVVFGNSYIGGYSYGPSGTIHDLGNDHPLGNDKFVPEANPEAGTRTSNAGFYTFGPTVQAERYQGRRVGINLTSGSSALNPNAAYATNVVYWPSGLSAPVNAPNNTPGVWQVQDLTLIIRPSGSGEATITGWDPVYNFGLVGGNANTPPANLSPASLSTRLVVVFRWMDLGPNGSGTTGNQRWVCLTASKLVHS